MANTVNYLLLLCAVQCYAQNSYYFENHKYCDDLSPYEASYGNQNNQGVYNQYQDINLDQILGVWYGVEKIPHSKGEYRIEHTKHECFYIDIKEQYIQMTTMIVYLLLFLVPPLSLCSNVKYCQNLDPTHDFDEQALLGMWYIHEYIFHRENETRTDYNPYCPIIEIRKLEDYVHGGLITRDLPTPPTPYPPLTNTPYVNRQYLQVPYRIRYFVIEWHEGVYHDDYHVKVNTSHKGFWPTDVPNGSVENMYRFFGGVIQVLKVANNYLVLNFCMRLPNSQLFSVVLSRNENQLTQEDLASIHNVFSKKHLSASSLKRVCENSATDLQVSILMYGVVGYLVWRSRS